MNHLPILMIMLFFTAAFLLPLLSRINKFPSNTLALLVTTTALIMSVVIAIDVNANGSYSYFPGNWTSLVGIQIVIDWVSVFMFLTINLIGLLILVFCRMDLAREIREGTEYWYYIIFFLLMAASNALVMSFDLFNIFVFTEIGTLTACALVAIKPKRLCVEAGLKYLVLSTLGSGMILLGISLIYMVTGYLNIGEVARVLPQAFELYPWNVMVALALFITGFGLKSALFPLHVWLPDAHSSAPTPSSAILSGLVVKIYIIVIARIIFQMFGTDLFMEIPIPNVILLFATFGIFAGSLMAISQTDIKRMLAYSSVAQVCYIYLGIALVTSTGIQGGLLHVFNHAVMKSLLFLAAGTIIYKTGIRKIEDLGGVGYTMPITMIAFSVGALSMVGLPGFSGFISKYNLAFGALEAGQPFYVAVILISSLLNAVYYLPIVVKAFFGKHRQSFVMDAVPRLMLLPLIVLAGINIYFGIFPGFLQDLVELAAAVWLQ